MRQPYRWQIVGMLVMILITTGLTLLTPLILRQLIDQTIPNRNIKSAGARWPWPCC